LEFWQRVVLPTPAVIILFIFILQFVFIKRSFGDLSVEETPGPIPNPAVKLDSADGTWGAAPWESRSLPKDLFLFTGQLSADR
jgi:hypothetical protein